MALTDACHLRRVPVPGAARTAGAVPAATANGRFAVNGQSTFTYQQASDFNAPYRGPNSLTPDQGRETFDATLYLGARLWPGGEAWITPEIDQGFGLDDTLGLAGFPSGEAYKVGRNHPYLRVPRIFLRHTVNLGGAPVSVERGLYQFAGSASADRLVVTVGKFGVADVFDTNNYAHDPRVDFLNWTAIDAGSFDYAADAWGYSIGAAVEWYRSAWTWRFGFFDMSDVPNSEHLEPGFGEFQLIAEAEHRHVLGGRPGRVLLTGYQSHARMALLDEAVRLAESTGGPVDLAAVRRFPTRTGVHLSLEQQLRDDLGAFARIGGASGNVETYEFTDVDRTVAAGLSLNGARWHRDADTAGLALIANEPSAERRRYLDAGGLGILIGDGKLPHPASERLVETYYSLHVATEVHLTLDYQWINHPAYNTDRGPVSVFAVRVHAEF